MLASKLLSLRKSLFSDIRFALEYIDDTSAPVLKSFNLDMSSQLLVLLFGEPVDTSTFNFSGITVQGASSVPPTQMEVYYTLTNSLRLQA